MYLWKTQTRRTMIIYDMLNIKDTDMYGYTKMKSDGMIMFCRTLRTRYLSPLILKDGILWFDLDNDCILYVYG